MDADTQAKGDGDMPDSLERKHLDRGGQHRPARDAMRVIGPALLVLGFGMFICGPILAISTDIPPLFFISFGGILFLFIGGTMTTMGFAGAVARYQANEMLPVAKDGVNYIAEGTQEGVKTATRAMATGLREGLAGQPLIGIASANTSGGRCGACGALNDVESNFCDQCGKALIKSLACPACGEANDPDARFCDACGRPLAPTI